jgi:hypothetical protein
MAGGTLGLPSGIPSDNALDLVPTGESGEPGFTSTESYSSGAIDEFARYVNREMSRAEPHIMGQREHMRENDRFKHSHQLSDTDAANLAAQRRPNTAVNEIQKFVKFAAGIERRTQQALLFAPRTVEDEQAQVKGELITKVYEWFIDKSKGGFERSLAFENKLTLGVGITDLGLSRVMDPSGGPRYLNCDPFQFWWPKTGRENLGLGTTSPVRWIARESDMDVDEAIDKWPDYALFLRAAAGGAPQEDQFPDFGYGAKKAIPYVVPWIMTAPLNKGGGGGSAEAKPGKVPILEWQYYDDEPGYYFFDPQFKDDAWLNEADFRKYRARLRLMFRKDITDYDEQAHRVYKRAYLLQRRIVLQEPRKLPTGDAGYTWNVMTGAWDRTDNVFVAFIRLFMDTQKYTNVMFRQVLEIMGASAKGGYLAETGAITPAQKRDIEDTGSRPGAINMVQAGAIQGQRIMPKPIPTLPQGSMEILKFCIDLTEQISGLSMSLLGNVGATTPGVSLRRQLTSAMVLLAGDFDSLSRYRQREGELIFEFSKLLADDRWIRVGGAFDGQALQLTKDPFAIKYDIVLDEIENDPNMRQYYTEQIMTLAPILVKLGKFSPALVDYINMPAQFRASLKKDIIDGARQQQELAEKGMAAYGGRGKPRSLEEIQGDVALKHSRAFKDMAQGQKMIADARAVPHATINNDLKLILDAIAKSRQGDQGDKKLSLEALQTMFDALRPNPSPKGKSK